MTIQEIITDGQINTAWGNASFGKDVSKRDVKASKLKANGLCMASSRSTDHRNKNLILIGYLLYTLLATGRF